MVVSNWRQSRQWSGGKLLLELRTPQHAKSNDSHHHIDHIGNPSGFLPTTDLVVGPGFRETELPGYPENPKAKILQADYDGRKLRQIDFDSESKGLKIGGFRAVDWFEDGSFYLLETTGVSWY